MFIVLYIYLWYCACVLYIAFVFDLLPLQLGNNFPVTVKSGGTLEVGLALVALYAKVVSLSEEIQCSI